MNTEDNMLIGEVELCVILKLWECICLGATVIIHIFHCHYLKKSSSKICFILFLSLYKTWNKRDTPPPPKEVLLILLSQGNRNVLLKFL